jgi:polyferredoxin
MKRISVSTLFGLVAGSLCASGVFLGHMLPFSAVTLTFILLNRAVMGVVIGASGLKLHWAWNGVVMGMLVGSIFSYFLFMNMGAGPIPVINLFANGLFGLMIEFFTTFVFKLPAETAASVLVRIKAVPAR